MLIAMAISSGVTSIPTSAVAVAVPVIHKEFNASIGELQWTLVGFSLAYSALLVLAGRLADVYGRKVFFLGGTVIYTLGALGASVAPDPIVLIISVVIMGVGAAVLTPASLSIITDAFEPAQRGTAIGIWAAASALVSGLGPALGGILAEWDWRSVFWINIPFAVVFFVMTLLAGRESRDPNADRHVDMAGLGTLAGGLTALTLVLNEGEAWGWTSPKSIILFVSAGVLLVLFFVLEPRARNPLVDFGFFRKRNYLGGNAALLAVNFALAAVLFFIPLYMQEVLGYSVVRAGALLLPLSATLVIALPAGGPISTRLGPRIPIVLGLILTALGCYLLTRHRRRLGLQRALAGAARGGRRCRPRAHAAQHRGDERDPPDRARSRRRGARDHERHRRDLRRRPLRLVLPERHGEQVRGAAEQARHRADRGPGTDAQRPPRRERGSDRRAAHVPARGSRWRSSTRSSRVSPTAWAWSCGCPWASPSPG